MLPMGRLNPPMGLFEMDCIWEGSQPRTVANAMLLLAGGQPFKTDLLSALAINKVTASFLPVA